MHIGVNNIYNILKNCSLKMTAWWTKHVADIWSTAVEVKLKVITQQAEVAQGVPGRLRPRIFLTFGTTRVVGRQP